ncbi:MAG: hypothetical protein H7263_17715, partial [Candidatus Sericytochromatia bacterium]|nr:hypothetical protein [Candidatus Sericytochromatia bacterium]
MDNVGLNNNINANMSIIRKVEKADAPVQNTNVSSNATSTYKPNNLTIASSQISPAKALYSFFDNKMSFPINKDVLHNNVVGAYFDKIDVSPSKDNIGLSGNATLPQISFDPTRNDKDFGRLDIPSVYMGGNSSNKELDAGLSWDKVYTNGQQTFTNDAQGTDGGHPEKMFIQIKDKSNNLIGYKDGNNTLVAGKDEKGNRGEKDLNDFSKTLQPNYAFRPFWRTTNTPREQLSNPNERQEVKFKDGKVNVDGIFQTVSTNKIGELVYKSDNNEYPLLKDGDKYYIPKSTWHNPSTISEKNPKDAQNVYFYPGQNISMSIKSGANGDVSLKINTSDNKTNFKQNFYAEGFGKNTEQSFKAVNSIDQFT